MERRFKLNKSDRKLMGVAAGVADTTNVDPLIVRLGFIMAFIITGPIALILYLAAGVLADQR